jgi:hypothetical protein
MRECDVRAPVHLGDGERSDVLEAADHLLHPEIAEHERLQPRRRAEKRQEALAVHVHGERLLADHLGADLLQTAPAEHEEGPHARVPIPGVIPRPAYGSGAWDARNPP